MSLLPVVFGLLVFFTVLILSVLYPGFYFSCLVFLYPFKQLIQVAAPALVQQKVWVLDAFFVLTCVLVVLRKGQVQSLVTRYPRYFVVCFFFYTYFLISTTWSGFETELSSVAEYTFNFVLFIFLAPSLVVTEKDQEEALLGIFILGGVLLVVLLFSKSLYADVGRISFELSGQNSDKKDTNPLAIADAAVLMMLFALYATDASTFLRALLFAAAFYIAFFSGRGEALAGVFMILFRIFQSRRLPKRAWTIGLILGISTLVALQRVPDSYWKRWSLSTTSTGSVQEGTFVRLKYITEILRNYWDTPSQWIQGMGGNYSTKIIGGYPHNYLVQALVETGLVGLVMMLYIVLAPLKIYWQGQYSRRNKYSNYFTILMGMMFIYYVVVGLKRGHMLGFQIFMYGMILHRIRVLQVGRTRKIHIQIRPRLAGSGEAAASTFG